jgi:hypothetical protein
MTRQRDMDVRCPACRRWYRTDIQVSWNIFSETPMQSVWRSCQCGNAFNVEELGPAEQRVPSPWRLFPRARQGLTVLLVDEDD